MPTYDYECTKCGHTFEAFQGMNDKPLAKCPKCKSALRRLIGGGLGVIFKGSGFYTTDYKRGSTLSGGNGNTSKGKEGDSKKTEGAPSKAEGNAAKAEPSPAATSTKEKAS
jgi:putative FmdB family regulatory protein